ncbi:MAG: hypothetical protein ACK5WB_06280 [Phycisphaerales bacterium]|jgi:hypothetical protein|nr:hypothetical protein [Phycisphaeraceae bacterium]
MANAPQTKPDLANAALPLPVLRSPLSRDEIISRVKAAAMRGRIEGFEGTASSGQLRSADFRVEAFGTPFDGELGGFITADASSAPGSTVRFATRMLPRLPIVFLIILILTVWPGVILTEKIIADYFPAGWYKYTVYWYYPLSVPTVPWAMWVSLRRSRVSIAESARRAIDQIAKEIQGQPVAMSSPSTGNSPTPASVGVRPTGTN